ncbi:hypothetical protein ACFLX0_02940 [Chloroflexota bacterium]
MVQLAEFIKDFTLIIIVAFAITALYPQIQAVWNRNVSGWKPNLRGTWRDMMDMVKKYPTATILPLL